MGLHEVSVTMIGHWESGWIDPDIEAFGWRQLKSAFAFERLLMCPVFPELENRTNLEQFADVDQALATCTGTVYYLEPTGDQNIFDLPKDDAAVYVFGNAQLGFPNRPNRVQIPTPTPTAMFAVNAAAIVLAHRLSP